MILQLSISRFDLLYPQLVKQQYQNQCQIAAVNKADLKTKAKQRELEYELAHKDQIKMISKLAKAEVISFQSQADTLKEELLGYIQQNQEAFAIELYSPQNLFVIEMLAYLSKQVANEQAHLNHLLEMVSSHLDLYIKHRQEDFFDSIEADSVIKQRLALLSFLVKLIFKAKVHVQEVFDLSLRTLDQQNSCLNLNLQGLAEGSNSLPLSQLVPISVQFEVTRQLFHHFQTLITDPESFLGVLPVIQKIFEHAKKMLEIITTQSRFYMLNHATNWKKQGECQKVDRRAGGLFSEILQAFIQFCCTYFRIFGPRIDRPALQDQCLFLFSSIFVEEPVQQANEDELRPQVNESYSLSEKLSILISLNETFYQVPAIVDSLEYWTLIQRGLTDLDNFCRKEAGTLLKENLHWLHKDEAKLQYLLVQFDIDKKQFENLWTVIFDVIETLESFSSHLTKSIWERTEHLYAFLKKNIHKFPAQGQRFEHHQLMNIVSWLNVLNKRALTHQNQNVRKFIQKELLQREYVTCLMSDSILIDLLHYLNEGLILKDFNAYTIFSKNNEMITQFYTRYFANDSVNLAADFSKFFHTTVRSVTHPQLIVSILKLLSGKYKDVPGQEFIGPDQLVDLNRLLESFRSDMIFGSKYLCFKYILQMLIHYIRDDALVKVETQSELMKVLGEMPFELFSASDTIIYTDREGLESASMLVEKIGKENVQSMIRSFLTDIFQIKAPLEAIPKFLGSHDQMSKIMKGIVKLVLILDTKYEDVNAYWWFDIMRPNLDMFYNQILTSSYLNPTVLDQKVFCFTAIYNDLLHYSCTLKFREALIQQTKQGSHLILERIEHSLLSPLGQYKGNAQFISAYQDNTRLISAFAYLESYLNYLAMAVRVHHIYQGPSTTEFGVFNSDSSLEKMVKVVLGQALQLSQLQPNQVTQKLENVHNDMEGSMTNNLGVFLWQHVCFELLVSMLSAYQSGIQMNMKKGIDNILVPDDVFTIGKSLVMNYIEFTPVHFDTKTHVEEDHPLHKVVVDKGFIYKRLQSVATFNTWAALNKLLKLFSFDQELQKEVQMVVYPKLSAAAVDFLKDDLMATSMAARARGSNWTKEDGLYNQVIFGLLKQTFLPIIISEIKSNQTNQSDAIAKYQEVCRKSWEVIKSLKGIFEIEALQEFLELAFNDQMIELLSQLKEQKEEITDFHKELAHDIFEASNHTWLIMRSTFNHLLFMFSKKPYLMNCGFQHFLVNFSICREIRSLDSQIHLYRMETIIPEVIPKDYENYSLDDVTYQGAYIRCLTLMIIEGMVANAHTAINCQSALDLETNQPIHMTLSSLENSIVLLFQMNKVLEKNVNAEMPYSQPHREKLRIWQSLIVLLQLLDPVIYTAEFRQIRVRHSGLDIVDYINTELWKTMTHFHTPNIRQYIDVFTVRFCLAFPSITLASDQFIGCLLNPNMRGQVSSSFLMVAGYCMVYVNPQPYNLDKDSAPTVDGERTRLKKAIFEAMIGFCMSNGVHARSIAQYFVRQMFADPIFRAFIPSGHDVLINFIEKSKDIGKIMTKYHNNVMVFKDLIECQGVQAILSKNVDQFGEFIHEPITEILKTLTQEVMTELLANEQRLGPVDTYWVTELKEREARGEINVQLENASKSQNQEGNLEEFEMNFQRKILPWDVIETKKDKDERKRNDVIMVASLIDKVPNLAGLARTCEIMNARGLVIDNKTVVKLEEFKGIAVTAERWLPIYEVKVEDLLDYLKFQKSNGYSLIGLEQTANSCMLNSYKFPKKCILLLGKEKEGIPQEYLGILDQCVEIPQYGIVRSLNVHVSGAICLWEYTKQAVENQ